MRDIFRNNKKARSCVKEGFFCHIISIFLVYLYFRTLLNFFYKEGFKFCKLLQLNFFGRKLKFFIIFLLEFRKKTKLPLFAYANYFAGLFAGLAPKLAGAATYKHKPMLLAMCPSRRSIRNRSFSCPSSIIFIQARFGVPGDLRGIVMIVCDPHAFRGHVVEVDFDRDAGSGEKGHLL